MPKDTRERTIDSGLVIRGGAGVFNPGAGGFGALPDHNILRGLTVGDPHTQYLLKTLAATLYTPLVRTVSAGAGLTGGGALSSNITLAVGAGTLISVSANAVSIADGAGYQFISTDSVGAPYYRNVSALGGDGLTTTDGVLAVGEGAGLTVTANAVALTTPGGLSVSTTNSATGSHTHAVASSSDPNASAALLATTAAGLLTLRNLAMRQAVQSQTTFATGFAGAGWRIDYGVSTSGKTSAEFDNLTVRGSARFYELLIQQIRATNGSVFVSSASKVVDATGETGPAWTVNGSQLTFNGQPATFATEIYQVATAAAGDSGRELYHGFLPGDLIRSQEVRWNGSNYDLVRISDMEVTAVSDLYHYQATLVSGSAPAIGADYVRVGSSSNAARQGSIYLSSDDNAAPFIDIVDGIASHADWNTAGKTKARLGKLTGISDTDFGGPLEGYGLYSQNVYLKGQIVVTGGNAATTDYVDNGLALKPDFGYVDGELAAAVAPLAQITYVDDRVTHIDGGSITTGTINANRIGAVNLAVLQAAVANLAALNANLGAVTAGQIVVGSANKLWLNDSADGSLAIGGTVKASAPFRVSAAGHLDAIDASFGTLLVDSTGAYITPLTGFNSSYGYKFKFGASVAAGLFGAYSSANATYTWLLNNKPDTTTGIADAGANSYLTIMGAAGSAKTSEVNLRAERIVAGVAQFTGLSLVNTSSTRKATVHADTFVVSPAAGGEYAVWHANNDGPGSLLDADTVDGKQAADFAWVAGSNTFGYEQTFSAAVNFGNYIRLSPLGTAPAYQSGYALIYLLNAGSSNYQLRAKIRSADGTKFVDYQITTT